MKAYKTAKGWAIFTYVTAALFIIVSIIMLLLPFLPGTAEDITTEAGYVYVCISILTIALMMLAALNTAKEKFVIDDDRVWKVTLFWSRELMLHEIKGYRVINNTYIIEPNTDIKKKISVSNYYSGTPEIIEWLTANYLNIDTVDQERATEELLSNDEYGSSAEERAEKLKSAKKTAKIVNIVGGVICAWVIFIPKPYDFAMLSAIIYPWICVAVMKYYGGLIKLQEKTSAAYGTVLGAVFATAMGVCIRGLLDFSIFDYGNVWLPSVLISVILVVLLKVASKDYDFSDGKNNFATVFIAIMLWGYGYGTTVSLNGIYDTTDPEVYDAKVLSKRISSGKHTSYYLELSPWGPQKEVDEVDVSSYLYYKTEKDDTVSVDFMKGRFGIPWFAVYKR